VVEVLMTKRTAGRTIKRKKQFGLHRKSLKEVQATVAAFARKHNVTVDQVRFESSRWDGTWVTVNTPETAEEKERRLRSEAAAKKRVAAEKRRQEKWRKQQEAAKATNFLMASTENVTKLNDELAAAVLAVLEANPKVKSKVLKKVGS
jgi:hypothetical protein